MTNKAILVENLSKMYHIGRLKEPSLNFQERLAAAAAAPFRRISGMLSGNSSAASDLDEVFWALDDVSFSIDKGEVVGIIGRNGAGKSTLLKLLSRITEPTKGRAVIQGRVGSLLEVGTGFHPELSGRENVYLNASILGMRKQEVDAKLDQIIDFSEIEQFIDTPTKHYSSGMRVRLAFSVAAHLEPEIMFVDEVLAVGDAAFRKKCSDKVQAIARDGSTVMVVSHNAQAVTAMCQRALWLNDGKLVADGTATKIVTDYLSQSIGLGAEKTWDDDSLSGGDIAKIRSIRICTEEGETNNYIDIRDRFCIETKIEVFKPGYGIVLKHDVYTSDNMGAFAAVDTENTAWDKGTWDVGIHTVRMWIPGNFLQVDTYPIAAILWVWEPSKQVEFAEKDLICVHISDGNTGPTAAAGLIAGNWPGPVRPIFQWDRSSEFEESRSINTPKREVR